MTFDLRILIPICLLLLSACESARWENPAVSPAQWDADLTACRQEAYARAQGYGGGGNAIERSRPGPEGEIIRRREEELERRRTAFESAAADDCMRRRGYARVASSAK